MPVTPRSGRRGACRSLVSLATLALSVIAAGALRSTTPLQAQGRVYYVSVAGSDANAGTEGAPFRTIQHAANLVAPGDTVIVEDGTYTGDGAGTPCASSTQPSVVCLARGGGEGAWVTFRARNPLGAKIDGRSNTSTYGFRLRASFIRVEGFDVFGMGNASRDAAGFLVYNTASDVVIANNAIHDIGRLCTDHSQGMSGIYVQVPRVTIEGNRFYDIGRFGPGERGCNPATNNYRGHDHGIYVNGEVSSSVAGARDVRVVNNLFSNLVHGYGVHVYPAPVANLSILHNSFAHPNPYKVGHVIIAASTTNARIMNNVFLNPTDAGIQFYLGTHTGMVVGHNLSSNSIADSRPSGVTFTANLEWTDPQLGPDLRPTSQSAVLHRALTLVDVVTDIVGARRPDGPGSDIGAYEFTTASRPPAPTGLRIIR